MAQVIRQALAHVVPIEEQTSSKSQLSAWSA
jgi:hypothetical protein